MIDDDEEVDRTWLQTITAAFDDPATDFIGGIIGAIGGTPDFGNAGFTVNDSKIVYGSVINALIYFTIVQLMLH